MTARRFFARLLFVFLAVFFRPGEIQAWPAEAYRGMVYDALALMPPSLSRVLAQRDDFLISGVSTLEGETASLIARDGHRGEPSQDLIDDVERRIERVVRMVSEHRPFRETAVELGRLLRIAANLSDPTVVGAGSPELRRVAPEYVRFVGLYLTKIPLVHDGSIPSPIAGASVEGILGRVAERTSASNRSSVESVLEGRPRGSGHELRLPFGPLCRDLFELFARGHGRFLLCGFPPGRRPTGTSPGTASPRKSAER